MKRALVAILSTVMFAGMTGRAYAQPVGGPSGSHCREIAADYAYWENVYWACEKNNDEAGMDYALKRMDALRWESEIIGC